MRKLTEAGREKIAAANRTHGRSRTKLYLVWKNMRVRCYYKGAQSYRYYGAKGIKVCARWLSFENFMADMGEIPAGCTLDRIDSTKDYSPENCRWSTPTQQSRNRTTARPLTVNGVTKLLCDWVEESGTKRTTIIMRLKRGWTAERAIYG